MVAYTYVKAISISLEMSGKTGTKAPSVTDVIGDTNIFLCNLDFRVMK